MIRKIFLFIIASSLLFADEVIEMSVDKTSGTLEDTFNLTVTIKGERSAKEPEIENLSGFDVTARSSSSKVNIINFKMSAEQIYEYSIVPQSLGTFTIGPAKIKINGKIHESNTITITIGKSQEVSKVPDKAYYLQAEVDNKSPFINEQISYVLRLFTRVDMSNISLEGPDFSGFIKESLGKEKQYSKIINGIEWRVIEIRTALFPTSSGVKEIGSAKIQAHIIVRRKGEDPFFDDFFFSTRQIKPVRLVSNPIRIDVQNLPHFEKEKSTFVGKLSMKASLNKNTLSVGESATLTVEFAGEGNIREISFGLPKHESLKVYEDKPTIETSINNNRIVGRKVFKFAIVPLKAGKIDLKEISFTYFDTTQKAYNSLSSGPLSISVHEGKPDTLNVVTADSAKKEIEVLGTDLMPIKQGKSIENQKLSLTTKAVVLFLVPFYIFIYFIIYLFRIRYIKLHSDINYGRRKNAYKNFVTKFKKLDKSHALYVDASNALRIYLGDKFSFDGLALTSNDVDKKLSGKLPNSTILLIKKELETYELSQYGGVEKSEKDIKKTLTEIVKKVEKEIRA